jgi:hypothetical protein
VLFGSDMIRNTAGSYCERVNRFLMETQSDMAQLPSRPETYFAAKEKNGPHHSLRDSRNAVPQNTQGIAVPQRTDASGPSASSSGVRSSSRRYVPSVNGLQRIQLQLQTPPQGQESPAMIKMPLTSLTLTRENESADSVQTAVLIPSETANVPVVIPVARPAATERYQQKLTADRNDEWFTLCMTLNVLVALGLVCCAVRLLG